MSPSVTVARLPLEQLVGVQIPGGQLICVVVQHVAFVHAVVAGSAALLEGVAVFAVDGVVDCSVVAGDTEEARQSAAGQQWEVSQELLERPGPVAVVTDVAG